jgi:pimeloyl-ACP methyl ester carboxylesterase
MSRLNGVLTAVDGSQFNGQVHVQVDGPDDGPVLILLHGFSGSLHWYDPLVERLRDTFRLVRVDLLGHGATGGAASDAPGQARMAQAVLEALGIDDAIAIGHSFGADVAVELAERSARVSGVVLLAQAPDYSDANLPRGNTIMTLPVLSVVLHGSARRLAGVLAAVSARRNPAGRDLARRAVADFRALNTAMFRVILVDRKVRMARRPLDAQLRDARKPALVVLGGRDHFYGARSAARYERAGAQVEILPESGHNPVMDFPDRTAELVREFVGRLTG